MATGSKIAALSTAGERQHDQPAKFSRYRSLRDKSAPETPNAVNAMSRSDSHSHEAGQQQDATSGNSIARSMSRYRRRANSVATNDNATQKLNSDPPSNGQVPPPVPAIPRPLRTVDLGGHQQKQDDGPGTPLTSPRTHPRHTDSTSKHRRRMSGFQSRPSTASDENQRRGTADRNERQRRFDEQEAARRTEEAARWEADTERMIAEQKKKDLQRLELQLANSQRASALSHKPRSPVIEKFVLLAKGRKSKDVLSPTTPTSGGNDWKGHATTHATHAKAIPTGIQVGGRGIVPQTDAPNSAINAGDRNVTVRYKHHTFSLEVTPETTPIDILFQASQKMTHDIEISPSSCVVIEVYGALGLERRLRRYERIRDVMNSWDRDAQNQLVVAVTESAEEVHDLDVSGIPSGEAPQGIQLYMYHSNRPGKWNKRWITLLENGQIFCAKKPNARTSDKDTMNLCRLSDYDIYTPTDSQMRRHLKPPKRYAFAVRSQQKTTVFLNTENYVHYFSTEDPKVAAQFKEKIHAWRSWYLLDRRPEARRTQKVSVPKTDETPPQITQVKHTPNKSATVATADGHRARVSVDESPYSIGQFEPLLDMKRFDKRLSQFGASAGADTSTMPKDSTTSHSGRPSREGKPKLSLKLIDTIKSTNEGAFTGGGLLGEGYEERKQAQAEADRAGGGSRNAAFTDGPSLLNKQSAPASPTQKPESPSWFPSAIEHSAKQRSTSSSSRPSTSAGVMPTRRQSLSSRPPPPPLPLGLINSNSSTRPATQHGQSHPHPLTSQPISGSGGGNPSHANRRGDRPKPLVDITPTFQEPPQWSKEGKGHGVKAPEGMAHLVDLISVGNNGSGGGGKNNNNFLEVPTRSAVLRRPDTSAGASSLARTRSKSAGAPRAAGEQPTPPVPALPGKLIDGAGGGEERGRGRWRERERERERERMNGSVPATAASAAAARERERERAKSKARERERELEREREYRERKRAYNSVPGRTGTLKTV
ncbi:hypothetical protein F5X96DRAFT_668923 [Biscogniauxia mediterranea]|nr:hypothetical protein F5X96DRAFT_668923 [Biscogniauxia mediterranea]